VQDNTQVGKQSHIMHHAAPSTGDAVWLKLDPRRIARVPSED
jgi:hypothetical protein